MVNRSQLSSDDVSHISYRIKACRVLTRLNQEEFAVKYQVPLATLKCWENGVVPRTDGIRKFIDAMNTEGIYVEGEWILNGYGTGPVYSIEEDRNSTITAIDDQASASADFLNLFKEKCKRNKRNPIVTIVQDNEMLPHFSKGDTIAGVLFERSAIIDTSIDSLTARPILVKMDNGIYAPRWVHLVENNCYVRSNENSKLIRYHFSLFGEIYVHMSERLSFLRS